MTHDLAISEMAVERWCTAPVCKRLVRPVRICSIDKGASSFLATESSTAGYGIS
jgi:hypothetical protein